MKSRKPEMTRRAFIETVAAAGAAAASATGARAQTAASTNSEQKTTTPQAPDGRLLKAGLIGCGGRGTGAAVNFLDAGPNLQIVALADVFPDRIAEARKQLKTRRG